MNKPIVATWGTGPTYRERIKHNIKKAIDTGYDNIMEYIILTDYPEEFDEFRKTNNKIIEILDIHKIRKDHPWSEKYEYIPKGKDEKSYGEDYWNSKHENGKEFSYSLNRFSLPKISELGFNKFVMCDCDTDIRYDKIVKKECSEEDFWEEYNTPVNSMKGCDLENISKESGHDSDWMNIEFQLCAIIRHQLSKKFDKEYQKIGGPFKLNLTRTEGPFRYYHFENCKLIKKYFEIWEEIMLICYEDKNIRNKISGGTYMTTDTTPIAIVNEFLKIEPLSFGKFWHTVNIYFQDRFFFPSGWVLGDGQCLKRASTLKEFYEINKDHIEYRKNNQPNMWID